MANEGVSAAGIELDHIGIAVKSLEAARALYQLLGLAVGPAETVGAEGVTVAMVGLEGGRLELLEATGENTVIGRFIARRGEGVHHVAMRVSGVDAEFARLREAGVRLVSDRVQVGAGGHRYFFVHPASAGGMLVEIVGD